jgi:hypothetical protein
MTTDVGPDPVVWIQRLLEVNYYSQFTQAQKEQIAADLQQLKVKLINNDNHTN